MALIKCTECGREISDSAKLCPHCGYKTSFGQAEAHAKALFINNLMHVAGMIVGVVLFFSSVIPLGRIDGTLADWLDEDPDNIFVIIKLIIGVVLFLCALVHYIKVSRQTNLFIDDISTKKETVSESDNDIPENNAHEDAHIANGFTKILFIPENKQCMGSFGKCEMCDSRGATARCQIPDFPDEYELCVDCINQYMAKIN